MKSKVILPVFTFILAIGLSFASQANRATQIGYWFNPFIPGIESGVVSCSENGSQVPCLHNGFQVYSDVILTRPLYRVFY